MANKIKKGVKVEVIAGKAKGKQGTVTKVLKDKNSVILEGSNGFVNMVKKHTKPNQQHQQGGIVEQEAPIHISNVKVV